MRAVPLLLGHRGTCGSAAAENSLRAFDLALDHGCEGFELDVRGNAEGQVVLCHDATFAAPGHGSVEVASASAAQCDALARLEDVLAGYSHLAFLDIEIKVRGIEAAVLRHVATLPPRRGFMISSFLPEVLLELRAQSAEVPLGLVCEDAGQLSAASELPLQYLVAHHRLLSLELLRKAHAAGRQVFAWTVNHPDDMRRFADWGVDGIISDETRLLARTVRYRHDTARAQHA